MTLNTTVAGIPCQVRVTHFHHQPPYRGSPHFCDSPDDYYGYTECEFEVLDRRGRPAAWLEKKLTPTDQERIEAEIFEAMTEEQEP